ncbi:hypothetical protein M0802_010200 [Mischocyttarus mexicanus]|nr:hypothetical protein M0802_010200 [Mischocyttarus mexicanus]
MKKLFDNDEIIDKEAYDKEIDEVIDEKITEEMSDEITYADFCELITKINADRKLYYAREFDNQRDSKKLNNSFYKNGNETNVKTNYSN